MSVALTGSVQTCSVNTGYANKLWSDTLCPLWNGIDMYGRVVSYDSYYTKAPGCESALDRVAVENYQRPQYIDFVPLDAAGYLNPAALGAPISTRENYQKTTELMREQGVQRDYAVGGSVGIQYGKVTPQWTAGVGGVDGCSAGKCSSGLQRYSTRTQEGYADTRANRNFQDRRDLSAISSWKSNCNACSAGNR